MGTSKVAIVRATKRVLSSSIGEIIGRAVNLIFPFALLVVHDASNFTDSFFFAIAIAFLAQGTLTNTLVNALVPMLLEKEQKYSLGSYLRWSLLLAFVLGAITLSYSPANYNLAEKLLVAISVVIMASSGLIAAPSIAKLNSNHIYGIPGFTWSIRLIPVVIYLIVSPILPTLHYLIFGIALADLTRTMVLIAYTRAHFSFSSKNEPLRFPIAAKYLIVASAIASCIPIAVRTIATTGVEGNLSTFEAADRLYAAIASLATIGVGNVTLVYLARLKDTPEEKEGWNLILKVSMFWSLAWLVAGILFWLAFPYIAIFIDFKSTHILTTVQHTFLALIMGIPAFIISGILSRRLITLSLSSSLVPISIINFLVTVFLSYLLFCEYGVIGLGIALAVSQYLVASMIYYKLSKTNSYENTRSI